MDMITADITDLPALDIGSPVTLWGDSPCIDEVAGHCDTIGYELCTRITQRTPRRFHRLTSDETDPAKRLNYASGNALRQTAK